MNQSTHSLARTWVASILLLGLSPGAVHATALFEIFTSAQLSVDGFEDATGAALLGQPDDLLIDTNALVFLSDTDEQGDATAIANPSATAGDGVTNQEVDLFGDANAPPASTGSAEAQTDGEFFLTNESSDAGYFVNFLLDFDYQLEATVDIPATESALASIQVSVLDDILTNLFDFEVSIDTDVDGSVVLDDIQSIDFSVFVAPDSQRDVFVTVDGFGSAQSIPAAAVPAPASLALVGLGLIGMRLNRRRGISRRLNDSLK